MTGNPVNGKSKPTYLLVLDMPEMMEAYERVGLQTPDAAFFKERQQRLAAKLQEVIPAGCVETIEANKLTNKIVGSLHDLLAVTPEAVVISTVAAVASRRTVTACRSTGLLTRRVSISASARGQAMPRFTASSPTSREVWKSGP